MEELLKQFVAKIIEKTTPETLVLVFLILLLSHLLWKTQTRLDNFIKELGDNSQTLARLIELVRNLVYGKKEDD
jgi:hypothetical protein